MHANSFGSGRCSGFFVIDIQLDVRVPQSVPEPSESSYAVLRDLSRGVQPEDGGYQVIAEVFTWTHFLRWCVARKLAHSAAAEQRSHTAARARLDPAD
jgi:hypothetical protein